MHWSELNRGDRVHHFEYGSGTVDNARPDILSITWDNPSIPVYHWSAELDKFLTRAVPSVATPPEPKRRVRAWLGEHLILDYLGTSQSAAAFEDVVRSNYVRLRITNEPAPITTAAHPGSPQGDDQ